MITEDYVSFETAKLLKEKGFNEKCFAFYNPDGTIIQSGIRLNNAQVGIVKSSYSAPTQQMAMKWLRKEHYCHIIIDYTFTADANLSEEYVSYCYNVENAKTYMQHTQNEWYNTFEQACEAAIKYTLENLI